MLSPTATAQLYMTIVVSALSVLMFVALAVVHVLLFTPKRWLSSARPAGALLHTALLYMLCALIGTDFVGILALVIAALCCSP